MKLHYKLTATFGVLLLLVIAASSAVLYLDILDTFVSNSASVTAGLSKTVLEEGNRRVTNLKEKTDKLAKNVGVAALIHGASVGGQEQRRLIVDLANRLRSGDLTELTAISKGKVLAKAHRRSDFGGSADSVTLNKVYLVTIKEQEITRLVLRYRQSVLVQNRKVGEIEAGIEISDMIEQMSKLFDGEVELIVPGSVPVKTPKEGSVETFTYINTTDWILEDGTRMGGFRFFREDKESRALLIRFLKRAGTVFIVALCIGIYGMSLVAKTLTQPLDRLATAASEISKGKLDTRIKRTTSDETGDLTDAFNRMAVSLQESREKLHATEQIATWRDMARMLAHEIKNPLSPIKTSVTTLNRAVSTNDPELPNLVSRSSGMILDELAQLEKLVVAFSEFARFPEPDKESMMLNRVVKKQVERMRESVSHVTFIDEYSDSVGFVLLDEGLFSEVIRNLLKNASEALHKGGNVRIETRLSADKSKAIVTIADSGSGIPEERRGQLFTPYFTTKATGTGLGLALSRKIMIDHGGDLVLNDKSPFEDAAGASFSVILDTKV